MLQIVGAGLPRTGTESLRIALARLLGSPCYHMRVIPGHPFDLGGAWKLALAGGTPDWDEIYNGYSAGVDWPTSLFWRELSERYPDALILLSTRDSADTWWQSINATILPHARDARMPGWSDGRDLVTLFERFFGSVHWDDETALKAAYDRHNADVRSTIPPDRLLDWRVEAGWEPICRALSLPIPNQPFPWTNRRQDWNR